MIYVCLYCVDSLFIYTIVLYIFTLLCNKTKNSYIFFVWLLSALAFFRATIFHPMHVVCKTKCQVNKRLCFYTRTQMPLYFRTMDIYMVIEIMFILFVYKIYYIYLTSEYFVLLWLPMYFFLFQYMLIHFQYI